MTEQIQILQRRLECISRDVKVLWIALKCFFFFQCQKPLIGLIVTDALFLFVQRTEDIIVCTN